MWLSARYSLCLLFHRYYTQNKTEVGTVATNSGTLWGIQPHTFFLTKESTAGQWLTGGARTDWRRVPPYVNKTHVDLKMKYFIL